MELREEDIGSTLYFTDSQGWTIAKLDLTSLENPGNVAISVNQDRSIRGIDRTWSITTRETPFTGEITLYYRNNYLTELGKENWYHQDDPIGDQWDLQVGVFQNGEIIPLPSRVNPYSNKVTAPITITGASKMVIFKD